MQATLDVWSVTGMSAGHTAQPVMSVSLALASCCGAKLDQQQRHREGNARCMDKRKL